MSPREAPIKMIFLSTCRLNTGACDSSSGASEKIEDLTVFSIEIGFTQILDKSSLVKTSIFYSNEDGYLYYHDDWQIDSHTLDTALNYAVNSKLMLGVGLRYYTQSEAAFYSDQVDYFTNQTYASSDRRMSSFDSINYKLSTDYRLTPEISINTNVNYYTQDEFDATYYGMGGKYWF